MDGSLVQWRAAEVSAVVLQREARTVRLWEVAHIPLEELDGHPTQGRRQPDK